MGVGRLNGVRWSEIYGKSQALFCHNNGQGFQTAGQWFGVVGGGGWGGGWGGGSRVEWCEKG